MNSLAKKLSQVMNDCSYVKKDARNEAQKYNYASAAAILEKVNASLVKNGIVTTTEVDIISSEREQSNGKASHYVVVKTKITLMDIETKDTMTTYGMGGGLDYGDKAIMKAQTASLKYAWMNCLNISTGDDPEADESIDKHDHSSSNVQSVPVYKSGSYDKQGGSMNSFVKKDARNEAQKYNYASAAAILEKASNVQSVPVYKNGEPNRINVFAEKYKQVKDKSGYFSVFKEAKESWDSFNKDERQILTRVANEAKLRIGLEIRQ